MSLFRRKGDKNKYSFLDRECIGRSCWSPGMYQHRGATLSGSRNTGSPDSPCCMHRAYHGCPDDKLVLVELRKERKAEGWKPA